MSYQFTRGEGRELRKKVETAIADLTRIADDLKFVHEKLAKRFPTPWHTKYRGENWSDFHEEARKG